MFNVQECLDLRVTLLFTFQMQSSNATVPLLWRTQLPPQTQLNLVHWSLTTACLDTPSTGMVQQCAPCTHFNGSMCPNAKVYVYERIRVIWNFSNSLVSRMLHVTTTCCTCDYVIILQHSNTPPIACLSRGRSLIGRVELGCSSNCFIVFTNVTVPGWSPIKNSNRFL